MKNALVVVAALVMVLPDMPAVALGRPQPPGTVSVEVVPDHEGAFPTIPHSDRRQGGTRVIKQYLEARRGETYGVKISNGSAGRIGVVIAVDGRNIISGRRSDLRSSEQMYIVGPYETARYDGWRTSRDQVNRFFFTDTGDSYAVRTFGDSSALGVIAVAVYREREQPRTRLEQQRSREAPAAPRAGSAERNTSGAPSEDRPATGFGDAQYAPVVTVQFDPERTAMQRTLVKYEWRDELCRKGIISCGQEPGNRLWDDEGFAPYPPGYPRS